MPKCRRVSVARDARWRAFLEPPRSLLLLLRPVVLVLEDADHARALAATVLLHLEQDRIALRERRARLVFLFVGEELAVLAVRVVPDALVVLVLDLEHG